MQTPWSHPKPPSPGVPAPFKAASSHQTGFGETGLGLYPAKHPPGRGWFLAPASGCTSPSSSCLGPWKTHHGFPMCCFLEPLQCSRSDVEHQGLALDGSSESLPGEEARSAQRGTIFPLPQAAACTPRMLLAGGAASSPRRTGSDAVFIALVLHNLGNNLHSNPSPGTRAALGAGTAAQHQPGPAGPEEGL